MPLAFTAVELSRTDAAAWVRLARPEVLNALDTTMVAELREAVRQMAADPPAVLVLTGAGRAFCAGADLKMVRRQTGNDLAGLRDLMENVGTLTLEIEALPVPTVAMVNGIAVAGGLELVLACDIVVAARSAKLGDAHANFGLVPGGGASQRLPRAVGFSQALKLMYTGDMVSADVALSMGLVTDVVDDDDLERETEMLASKLAERSAAGLSCIKRMVREGTALPLADGLTFERERRPHTSRARTSPRGSGRSRSGESLASGDAIDGS